MADTVSAAGPSVARHPRVMPDQISTESAAFLKSALAGQPEIRPDVVERARALAADPSYPSAAIMKSVAGQILASPDLSEDAS
jgi:hypothetical protein